MKAFQMSGCWAVLTWITVKAVSMTIWDRYENHYSGRLSRTLQLLNMDNKVEQLQGLEAELPKIMVAAYKMSKLLTVFI